MMENTLENKKRFFALHWNLEVAKHCTKKYFVKNIIDKVGVHYFLELKPLSSITDEDSLKVAEIFDLDKSQIEETNLLEWIEALYNEVSGYYIDGYTGNQLLSGSDYIRSKGYALPWMGLSVEKLQEYGWIKPKKQS